MNFLALRKVLWVTILVMIVLLLSSVPSFNSGHSNAASSSDFANANTAINSAFISTHNAEQSGGNVTALIAKLDTSLGLVQKAEAENATNPSQATADLLNATTIANQVLSQAPAVAQQGSSSREALYEESIGSAVAILVIAALIYIYGARIYHLSWFYLYRHHAVRSGEENVGQRN